MKKQILNFTLYAIIVYFTGSTLNPAIAASQPSGGNGAHFCGVIDDQSRFHRDSKQLDNRHYARTFAANLNVGDPRTVRLIYFLPNDRPYRVDIVQRMKDEILNVQTFYAESMKVHGYDMIFKIETDAQGDPVVHRVNGQQPEIYYIDDTSNTVRAEIEEVFDVSQNIYFIVIDNSIDRIGTGVGEIRVNANAGNHGKNGGSVLIPAYHFQNRIKYNELEYDKLSAHEIGHAFGLQHDFRSGGYIMSYGAGLNRAPIDGPDQDRLSKCNADFLSVHSYFNSGIPTESGRSPTIELISPSTYPAGSGSVDIQAKVTDSEGIHQVILYVGSTGPLSPAGFPEVKTYRKLMGEKEVIVKFEYDGDVPGTSFTKLSMRPLHNVHIAAIDISGDTSNTTFTLSEERTEQADSSKVDVKILEGKQEVRESNSYNTWGLPTGARIRIGKGGAGNGDRSVAFSPNGQYLAVSSSIGIWLYDTVNYQEIALLSSQYPITNIAFSPDGNAVVGASRHGHIQNQVWSIITKEKIATFGDSLGGSVGAIAFAPNGKTIASVAGNRLILWDVETEQELIRMESVYVIDTLSFSHDGSLIAAAGWDGLVKVWEVLTGQLINTFRHDAHVNSIAFSPTENILASGSGDTTVKLWNTVTGIDLLTIKSAWPISVVAFSSDGKTLAWSDASDIINLWEVAAQSLIAIYENSVSFNIDSIALSPDNKTFVTVDAHYDIVKVWDMITGNTIDLGHVGLTPISFSLDSTLLASGGRRGVKLWDVNTGENVANIPIKLKSRVRFISFSPDSRTLAYRVSGEKFTRLWDVTTQTQGGIIENKSVNCWAFSPDGKTLASAAGRIITLWDVATGQNIDTLEGHLETVESIVYSPDGNTLASGSSIEIRLWDITTKQTIKTFEGESGRGTLSPAAFSPDGALLVFSKLNVGVKVYHRITQNMTLIPEDYFMTFLPNSSMMLLRSFSHESGETVSAWDAKTSAHIAILNSVMFEGWKHPIFSPDGKTLAIMGQDSTVLFEPEVIYNQSPRFAPYKGVGYVVSKTPIHTGDTFTLAIRAEDVVNLAGWQFDIAFDPAALEAIDVKEGDFLKMNGEKIFFQGGSIDNAAGKITQLSAARLSSQGVTGTGTLLQVTFKAKSVGETELALENFEFAGITGQQIPAVSPQIRITVEERLATGDVNGDGRISILDLVLIAQQLGNKVPANSPVDLNRDGVVSILDIVLVARKIGSTVVPAAPPVGAESVDAATVEAWIAQARLEDDGSLVFKQGIEILENLLASLIPEETALLANYPNPFNPETWIPYQLATSAEVTLIIYDMNGQLVRRLAVGHQVAGMYRSRSRAAYWDGRNQLGEFVASGLYFYTLTAGEFTATRKMLILK